MLSVFKLKDERRRDGQVIEATSISHLIVDAFVPLLLLRQTTVAAVVESAMSGG